MRPLFAVLLALASLAGPTGAAPPTLDETLAATSDDSLVVVLRRWEARRTGPLAGEASMILGELHFARGEYRPAEEAFGRSAARLGPERKPEARYWQGLCWLALGDPAQARALLEEVAHGAGARRADALLGVAQTWALAGRADREAEVLERLVAGDPGEAGPAALERLANMAQRQGSVDDSRRWAARLRRDFPGSVEAARMAPAEQLGAAAGSGRVMVRLGAFSTAARAEALAASARRYALGEVRVESRGEGSGEAHVVLLGPYATPADARAAGERAAAALGLTFRLERER